MILFTLKFLKFLYIYLHKIKLNLIKYNIKNVYYTLGSYGKNLLNLESFYPYYASNFSYCFISFSLIS